MGGREVLIKAVAQVIFTYTMSCSMLPVNLCNGINTLCSRFWQGAVGNERKVHQRSWKRLCLNKQQGRMGLRDISIFNHAMSAKQSCRLIKNLDNLATKMLRGRYYQSGNFLKAKLGSNPSYAWRSILWGMKLFKNGYRWRIGNELSEDVMNDPWLPRENNYKPIIVHDILKSANITRLKHTHWCLK